MAQTFTSAATSINGKQGKLPALYTKVHFPAGSTVFDYGCGDHVELIKQKAKEDGFMWVGYDKYHQSRERQIMALDFLHLGAPFINYAVSCNVLNVIDDEETIKEIISDMVTHSIECIFQIYEGNKSNVGKQTGKDQWQRNNTRQWYEELIKSLGYTITKATGNFIYVKGEN